MKTSSCNESGVGNRTAVKIRGPLVWDAADFAAASQVPPTDAFLASLFLLSAAFGCMYGT